jgi:hypothetical protein
MGGEVGWIVLERDQVQYYSKKKEKKRKNVQGIAFTDLIIDLHYLFFLMIKLVHFYLISTKL